MSLTSEQKQKIEKEEQKKLEEEKYREKVKNNIKKGPWWKPKGVITWIIVIIFFWVVVANIIGSSVSKDSSHVNPSPTPGVSQANKDALSQTFCDERTKSGIRYVNLDDFIAMYNANGKSVTLRPAGNIYPTPENCKKVIDICLQMWDLEDCKNIAERKIWIGMTDDELILSWGLPNDRNNSTYSFGVKSQWVYGDFGPYVYLEGTETNDMKVTSWQD
ncbi:MAG TPA: hypothetical protein VG965_05400 [Patescibacteria group bacterium]|nr:hypothetical protein [Patescibacteria group bacterium]